MRVLVVGASGAIGTRLVPQLRERGHEVIGSSLSSTKSERLRALGSQPIVLDALDADAVRTAVAASRPDAVIYEATSLADLRDFKHFDRSFAQTNRLRTAGVDILIAAAREAGVGRIVAQSYAPIRYERKGGPVKSEDDPLDASPPAAMRETVAAMAHLDKAVTDAGGIALRYGSFYGDPADPLSNAVRARKWPIIGDGAGVASWIHLEDAAAATVLALERELPAIYNIADDEPAPARVWLPELAKILGAPPPLRLPRLMARLLAGQALVVMSTESRGASNAKAKRELSWKPRYPSWRQGFAAAYGPALSQ
ncbi:MAG TPA: NAD(P)-dependent oxidoreductase [Candidatus Tumulicola sp.]|jgi:nucleoside-diphosphate-sugar epimerase